MTSKDWDKLQIGDSVIALNGVYQQNSVVVSKRKDERGIRWITYFWKNKKGEEICREKRFNSVYLPQSEEKEL